LQYKPQEAWLLFSVLWLLSPSLWQHLFWALHTKEKIGLGNKPKTPPQTRGGALFCILTNMITVEPTPSNYKPDFFLPYTQRPIYGELQKSQGRLCDSFLIRHNEKTIGYMSVIVFPLLKDLTHVYIPYGPVLLGESPEAHEAVISFLKTYAEKRNAVFTRLDYWHSSEYLSLYSKLSSAAYHAPYFQPRGEMILDISAAPDALLESMHKKTRYNIRKSERNGLTTTIVSGKNIEIWADTFIVLNEQNAAGHRTTTHPKPYFKELFKLLATSEEHFLSVTKQEQHVVAINIFVVFDGVAYCPFGASNDAGKKLGAYYHIKWHSILHMKEHDIKTFNWGGVSVSKNDLYLEGVTKFKSGFGGEIIEHNPIVQIVHKPFWNLLYVLRKSIQKF